MADKQQNSSKPLRWFHVRLRTLLLGITLVAVVLAAFAALARPYLQQRELISAITKAGGTVETRRGPKWLRNILGAKNCHVITLINLADITPDDDILAEIASLPDLEILVLGGTELDDRALRSVPKCDSLQAVILDSTLISDEGITALRDDHPGVYIARCDRKTEEEWQSTVIHWMGEICVEAAKAPSSPSADVVGRLPAEFFEEIISVESDYESELGTKLLPTMHELRGLMLKNPGLRSGLSQSDFEAIAKCDKLEWLRINGRDSSSEIAGIESLGELANLRSLSLRNVDISDEDIRALAPLTRLQELELYGTLVQDPASWPRFPLKRLLLDDTFIENDDLPALAQYDGLEELSLAQAEVTDEGLPSLLPLKELRAIRLAGARITEPSYETLCQFPLLQQVALGSAPLRKKSPGADLNLDVGYQWVPPFGPKLHEWFFAEKVPYADFDPATFKPSPEESAATRATFKQKLGAAWVQTESPFESMHLDLLQDAAGIRALDLSSTLTCDDDIRFIVSMPDLEVLRLTNTWVTDEGVRQLVSCPKLRALDLVGTAVSYAGIMELEQLSTLEELLLPEQTVRGDSFHAMCGFPNLRGIQLQYRRSPRARLAADYDVEDMAAFADLLQSTFRRLDIDGNQTITFAEYAAKGEFDLVNYAVFEDYPLEFHRLMWDATRGLLLTPAAEAWLEQNYPEPVW